MRNTVNTLALALLSVLLARQVRATDQQSAGVCDDALMEILFFLPGIEIGAVRRVCRDWAGLIFNSSLRRWNSPGDTCSILCLNSRRIAECAKWLRDENKDKGDQSAVLLTPMANVHFSFGEDDPVHPLGLHPCTVYSRAHPKGRHTMWQLIDGDLTSDYPSIYQSFENEAFTPDIPCYICKSNQFTKTELVRQLTVHKPEQRIQKNTVDRDLVFHFKCKGIENEILVSPEQSVKDLIPMVRQNMIPDLDSIIEKDPRFQHPRKYQVCFRHACWVTGHVLVLSKTICGDPSVHWAVIDAECRSVQITWPGGDIANPIIPTLKGSLIRMLKSSKKTEITYCIDQGKMVRKARTCPDCRASHSSSQWLDSINVDECTHLKINPLQTDSDEFLSFNLVRFSSN